MAVSSEGKQTFNFLLCFVTCIWRAFGWWFVSAVASNQLVPPFKANPKKYFKSQQVLIFLSCFHRAFSSRVVLWSPSINSFRHLKLILFDCKFKHKAFYSNFWSNFFTLDSLNIYNWDRFFSDIVSGIGCWVEYKTNQIKQTTMADLEIHPLNFDLELNWNWKPVKNTAWELKSV